MCALLDQIANGVVTYLNGQAQYACSFGYTLIGNSTRKCTSTGQWSGNTPSCIGIGKARTQIALTLVSLKFEGTPGSLVLTCWSLGI